ncbi:unnamed protein product [Meloidogyne enterolobii]|uniref:Uncharacterized protein n=1 Tax=Meloidogyne enterolobii TaxID=390850 RepID=A0ACB0YK41_MELEN
MVEKRRRLNNALNTRKPGEGKLKGLMGGINLGPKARNPMCARCTAHGKESALRGHKKAVCPFRICECEKCGLVEERRRLMAAQIKLRRRQKKAREGGTDDGSIDDDTEFCEILNSSSSPLIGINKEINNTKIILTKQQKKPRQQYKPRKQWNNSNNFLIESRKELNFGGGRLSLEKHQQTTNFQHFQDQFSSKINLQQKQQASLNLFLNNSTPRQFNPLLPQQPQPQPTTPQITSNLISAYLNSIASQHQQQQQQQSSSSINSQHIFVASQPIPLQQQPLTPLQIATLVNNTQQQKQQQQQLPLLPSLPSSLLPSTTNPSLPLPPLPISSTFPLPSSSTINTSSPPSQNPSLLPLPFQLPPSSLPLPSSSTNSSPPSSSSSNLIYEWLYSLPTSLLAQIPPINLIQPPQQPFDSTQQTNLQSTLQTLNFMRLNNNLAENSKAMETEEENEDDNRKRATASEGIQQLSDRTPVLFSTPPLTQQTLTNNVTLTNLINPLIIQQQTIIPSQELSTSSSNLNNSSNNPFCINSILSLFNQVSQQQQ